MAKPTEHKSPWITDADWVDPFEGQLAVDVLETDKTIVIRSAIAGIQPEDFDIHVTTDTVTIRGKREAKEEKTGATYHIEECHWGSFSRSVVLPAHVRPDEAEAVLKNGILTITLPKTKIASKVRVTEVD